MALPSPACSAACVTSIRGGGKLMFFGNGGSAADAQHLATELTIRYKKNRAAIAALALTTDTSALTAAGNDLGFEQIFARQIEALGRKGDVAIAHLHLRQEPQHPRGPAPGEDHGPGHRGLRRQRRRRHGALWPTICWSVPSDTTARIQEMHITLGQMLCGALEIELGLAGPVTPRFPLEAPLFDRLFFALFTTGNRPSSP